MILDVISVLFGIAGVGFGLLLAHRLYVCERQLHGARIAIAYKGRVKMNQPLFDWLVWVNSLDADETTTGRVVYRADRTTVAILKRPPSERSANVITRKIHSMVQRHRTPSPRSGS